MPRPLPKKSKIRTEPTAAMVERPKLAVYVARIATGWSHVEQRLGYLIVELLGAHARTGMKMYSALSGAAAQKAVLRAVARDRLPATDLETLESILSDYKKVAGQRNAVVHGFWEISDNHPDELVWTDNVQYLFRHSEFWAGYHSHTDADELIEWILGFEGTEPQLKLLYGEQDFEAILDRIRALGGRLQSFGLRCNAINKERGDIPGL